MTFEEWYREHLMIKHENYFGSPSQPIEDVREAWDYQQNRIDELLFLIQKKIEADIAADRDWTDEQQQLWEVMADMTVPAWREIEEQE